MCGTGGWLLLVSAGCLTKSSAKVVLLMGCIAMLVMQIGTELRTPHTCLSGCCCKAASPTEACSGEWCSRAGAPTVFLFCSNVAAPSFWSAAQVEIATPVERERGTTAGENFFKLPRRQAMRREARSFTAGSDVLTWVQM